jgi:UDP-glucose 4-epimerase
MVKSILITGGAGLVGSNFARLAVERGLNVTVLDNCELGKREYLKKLNINFVHSDLLFERNLKSIFLGHELVLHFAAQGNVMQSLEDPISNFNANVTATLNVLQACREAKIENFIFSSTGGALMGNTAPPVNEFSLPDPISPYGASKLASEGYIKAFSKSYGINCTIFRFGNVLGPNCRHKTGVINQFYKKIKNSEALQVFGNVTRDFIFVDDLNNAILNSFQKTTARNQIFHLASGVETPITDIATKVEQFFGRHNSKVEIKPGRLGEVERNFADVKKAKQFLGLRNSKTTIDVVEEVLNYLESDEN